MRTFTLRSPLHHRSSPCSWGPGLPNPQNYICLLMPFFLFIYGRRSASASSRTHLLVLTVKLLHNAGIYLNGCSSQSFFHIYFLWMTPFPCPRFFTLRAVLTFSSDSYPHTGQINLSSAFFPGSPHSLHSLLMSFPNTSTICTDCSLHFCSRRFLMYPLCHWEIE